MEMDEAMGADMIGYLEWQVGSYFQPIFAFNFLFGHFYFQFHHAISLRHEKKEERLPFYFQLFLFFSFNYFL